MRRLGEFIKQNREHFISGLIVLLGMIVIGLYFQSQTPQPQISSTTLPELILNTATPSAVAVTPSPSPSTTLAKTSKKQVRAQKSVRRTKRIAARKPARQIAAKRSVKKVAYKKAKSVAYSNYSVKRGDSLWKITVNRYGRKVAWQKIYQVNRRVVGKNPHLIYPRQNLRLPRYR